MNNVDAVVIRCRGKYEVRCGKCGKLLLICKFTDKKAENIVNPIDKTAQNVIIVARCTRSDCKADNSFSF